MWSRRSGYGVGFKATCPAAIDKGLSAKLETIGMAQRGGSVVSHVRGNDIKAPMIPEGSRYNRIRAGRGC
ncbi:MAG: hypothetical protein ACLT2Z_00010 [Eubacterium sp.]